MFQVPSSAIPFWIKFSLFPFCVITFWKTKKENSFCKKETHRKGKISSFMCFHSALNFLQMIFIWFIFPSEWNIKLWSEKLKFCNNFPFSGFSRVFNRFSLYDDIEWERETMKEESKAHERKLFLNTHQTPSIPSEYIHMCTCCSRSLFCSFCLSMILHKLQTKTPHKLCVRSSHRSFHTWKF